LDVGIGSVERPVLANGNGDGDGARSEYEDEHQANRDSLG
jgi:hypothetical protein